MGLFNKKKQPKEKPKEVINKETDYYTLATEEIEREKELEEANNILDLESSELQEETTNKEIDISAFQEQSNISFFDPDYISKTKKSLFKGGFNNIYNQLGDLEDAYIGHEDLGKISISPEGEISTLTTKLFDKIFINKAYHKSLEGRLNKLNGFTSDYKEFHKAYLKKDNSKISYEDRKKLLNSLGELSKWISGEDIKEIKEKLCNINNYLLEEIKEETIIDNSGILIKRIGNLIREYNKEFSSEQNLYYKFQEYANTIDEILDSVSDFDFTLLNETKIDFHNFLTKRYAEVQENKNIGDPIKQEVKQTYLEIFERLHGIPYEEAIKQATGNVSIS